MLGEVPELIAKVPGLCLKGAECILGVLPKFCVCVPGSHVKEQIENGFIVRRKEETIEHRDAALDEKGSEVVEQVHRTANLEYVFEVPRQHLLHC